jgi:hypothetical protein
MIPEDGGMYSSEASVSTYETAQCQPRRPQSGFSHLILDYIILPASEVSMMVVTVCFLLNSNFVPRKLYFHFVFVILLAQIEFLCSVFHFRFLWCKEQNM